MEMRQVKDRPKHLLSGDGPLGVVLTELVERAGRRLWSLRLGPTEDHLPVGALVPTGLIGAKKRS